MVEADGWVWEHSVTNNVWFHSEHAFAESMLAAAPELRWEPSEAIATRATGTLGYWQPLPIGDEVT